MSLDKPRISSMISLSMSGLPNVRRLLRPTLHLGRERKTRWSTGASCPVGSSHTLARAAHGRPYTGQPTDQNFRRQFTCRPRPTASGRFSKQWFSVIDLCNSWRVSMSISTLTKLAVRNLRNDSPRSWSPDGYIALAEDVFCFQKKNPVGAQSLKPVGLGHPKCQYVLPSGRGSLLNDGGKGVWHLQKSLCRQM